MDIGYQIKQFRTSRGLSLRDFAEKCELSPSLVSQVERNVASPSIQSLIKMAEVLNVPVASFFEEKEKEAQIIVKKDKRRKLTLPENDLVYELLTPSSLDSEVRLLTLQLEPNQYSPPDKIQHNDQEICFVITGNIDVIFDHKVYHLEQGDTISFDSNSPHHFFNPAKIEAKFLLVVYKQKG